MLKNRLEQSLDEQVDSVWDDPYLRHVSSRNILEAEKSWKTANGFSESTEPYALEIGGAGGITKRLRPGWTVTDIRRSKGVDQVVDASNLPFAKETFDIIFAIDVIHHVSNLKELFAEVDRVLKPGGIFFIREPYWGPAAQLIWRFIHPEDFSLKRLFKVNLDSDPMIGNQALAYALLRKSSLLPSGLISENLSLHRVGEMTGAAFLLSGGATFRTKIPRGFILFLDRWELKHKMWLKIFGFSTGFYYRKDN